MKDELEIRDEINRLRREMEEELGNIASHSLDLSDCFQRTRRRYTQKIRQLETRLTRHGAGAVGVRE